MYEFAINGIPVVESSTAAWTTITTCDDEAGMMRELIVREKGSIRLSWRILWRWM